MDIDPAANVARWKQKILAAGCKMKRKALRAEAVERYRRRFPKRPPPKIIPFWSDDTKIWMVETGAPPRRIWQWDIKTDKLKRIGIAWEPEE